MRILIFMIFLGGVCGSATASADSLFYDSCIKQVASDFEEDAQIELAAVQGGPSFMGLTCEELKGYSNTVKTIEMALYPATLVLATNPARGIIARELVSLGLTMANPAILSVTVIGAFGVVTVYFILKKTLDECEQIKREDLKRAILLEFERRYGIQPNDAHLQLKK